MESAGPLASTPATFATLPRRPSCGKLRIRQCAPGIVNKRAPRLERTGQSLTTIAKRSCHVFATSICDVPVVMHKVRAEVVLYS